mmetsp:Transcript_108809/g.347311  ORF Transcript_108809/g.347311 Transcript_108809/m.347311 type:complete len:755 (+) Transcript_108809:103-2367(+)|eukprot:CAMPEP_0203947916 /NCGR_PEP_ID=MMETSP0359-20131031/82732_1 /ASSEMBLY_ACC=CAM_ASM_000338 /TAXON_ID=268821 /ORGANISM="Scrippsiella Hangoei, Strain SHTV-5" /LENGTH=754 /DNA_ID=CAMNT_0050879381 /DNA_START=61 /DNA_END=2325 /DNA_ORIENTATION=+
MKFGKQIKRLADPTHLHHCIAYDVLKKAITVVVESETKALPDSAELREVNEAFGQSGGALSGVYRPPDSRFHGLLQHELAKVNRFTNLQFRTLLDTLHEAHRRASKDGPLSEEKLSELERLLDTAAEKLIALEHFRRLNFTGFRKIVKKFDKQTSQVGMKGGSVATWFLPALLREFFVAEPLDAHVMAIALGYAALRRHRTGLGLDAPAPRGASQTSAVVATMAAAAAAPPATTKTFWLMPPARLRALCALIKRFELVVPATGFEPEGAVPTVEKMRRLLITMAPDGPTRAPLRLAAENSLVYYDGADFSQYMERITTNGACGIRYRETSHGAAGSGLVEFDGAVSALGADAFTSMLQGSPSEAFPLYRPGQESLQESGAGAAVVLSQAAKIADHARVFASHVQELVDAAAVRGQPLEVKAVVGSSRVLLRGDTPATEGVAIALDEDVQFTVKPLESSAATAPSDAIDFPYCLLEVASDRDDGASAQWLEELWSYASVRTVQGFSVGAHAVASLHKEQVPELPHWYEHLLATESSAPPEAWGLMLEWRAAINEDTGEQLPPDVAATVSLKAAPLAPAPGPAPAIRSAGEPAPGTQAAMIMEPKNCLASERTMLEWVHTVLALAFLGIGLWKYSLSLRDDAGMPNYVAFGLLNAATNSSLLVGAYSLVLVAIALGFVWYAVLSHTSRLSAMFAGKITESIFNSRKGPIVFVVTIGAALFAQWIVQVVFVLQQTFGQDDGSSGGVAMSAFPPVRSS